MLSLPNETKLLAALRAAGPGGLSAEQLARLLSCNRSTVLAHIQSWCQAGYEILSDPHRGFRLVEEPDRLLVADLLSRITENRIVGSEIRVLPELPSTSDLVEQLAREGAAEGLTVFAESQTAGRGRLGRSWFSPGGQGLWFSVLLRPPLHPQAITRITIAAATALMRGLQEETGLPLQIKWPNDITARGRKLAGILTELRGELDKVKEVIVGIGVNVNVAASEFPAALRPVATSLKIEAKGRAFSRPLLAGALLRELDQDYHRLLHGDFASLAVEWEQHCATLGRDVQIQMGRRTLSGRAEALDENGALLLRTEHGHLERVIGGDVSLDK